MRGGRRIISLPPFASDLPLLDTDRSGFGLAIEYVIKHAFQTFCTQRLSLSAWLLKIEPHQYPAGITYLLCGMHRASWSSRPSVHSSWAVLLLNGPVVVSSSVFFGSIRLYLSTANGIVSHHFSPYRRSFATRLGGTVENTLQNGTVWNQCRCAASSWSVGLTHVLLPSHLMSRPELLRYFYAEPSRLLAAGYLNLNIPEYLLAIGSKFSRVTALATADHHPFEI